MHDYQNRVLEGERLIHTIDGDSSDWEAVYLDDKLYYEGHSIPGFIWLQILGLLVNVNSWESEWPAGRAEPSLMDQLRLDCETDE